MLKGRIRFEIVMCATLALIGAGDALAQTDNHFAFGQPQLGMTRTTSGYTALYHPAYHIPLWVCYKVEDFVDTKPKVKRLSKFRTDTSLPEWARLTHQDYTKSGFDRGHMFPHAAAEQGGKDMVRESYLMTNICPQTAELNQGIWKHLEAQTRRWAKDLDDVWVISGPILAQYDEYGPVGRKKSGSEDHYNEEGNQFFYSQKDHDYVVLPWGFYKIVIDKTDDPNEPHIVAFMMPQEIDKIGSFAAAKARFSEYLVTVDEIERYSGIDFLPEVNEDIESRYPTNDEMENVWKLSW